KSRFFLALILLGPWVRASGGAPPEGVKPYWTLCTEASQIFGLLNSRKFHVYRPTNDVDFEDLELSTPFHKYDHVCGEGFLAQTRRERRAYPSAVCKE